MQLPEENSGDGQVAGDKDISSSSTVKLAGGRTLPDLLFVTAEDRLRTAVGDAADTALKMIKDAGQQVFDIGTAADPWKAAASAASGKAGVVIIGGYDVVPSLKLDCLPPPARALFSNSGEPDDFRVWSDEAYADLNGDGLADLPVSRVPDGHSADLLRKALTGPTVSAEARRFGLRNVNRPFADDVYKHVPGTETMLHSEPVLVGKVKGKELNATHLYVMLHGAPDNLGTYWGETSACAFVEAMKASCVDEQCGGTVFAGCCYGALTVEERAHELASGDNPTVVPAADSIALQFLAKGAGAFVGCTGAHYSPLAPSGDGSDVLHRVFWGYLASGQGAAEALFNAKIDFVKVISSIHDPGTQAVGYKTWRQFKCLGLGW